MIRYEPCAACAGTGWQPDTDPPAPCRACGGIGYTQHELDEEPHRIEEPPS